LTQTPLIYSVSHCQGLEFCLRGAEPTKSPRGDGTTWSPTDVYFGNCITKPCQVGHTSFGCSAVITTSYVRLQLR